LKKIKFWHVLIALVAIVLIIAVIGYFQITKSTTVVAFLNVEEGNVQVNHGKGWIDAVDEMELGLKDRIKTLEDGYASVVLFESTIISLDPGTEILIENLEKAHQKIKQEAGSTWNKFTGLAGVEGLSIETPTTVATVRGTSFGVDMKSVVVGEGEVEVDFEGEKFMVQADEKVEIEEVMEAGKLRRRAVKKALTQADRERVLKKMKRAINVMKKLRKLEIKKKEFIARRLQKKYDISDRQVDEYLEKADKGEYDLEEVERKSPVKMESVSKIRRVTEKIVEENKAIERLLKKRAAKVPLEDKTEQRLLPEKPPEPAREDISPVQAPEKTTVERR